MLKIQAPNVKTVDQAWEYIHSHHIADVCIFTSLPLKADVGRGLSKHPILFNANILKNGHDEVPAYRIQIPNEGMGAITKWWVDLPVKNTPNSMIEKIPFMSYN